MVPGGGAALRPAGRGAEPAEQPVDHHGIGRLPDHRAGAAGGVCQILPHHQPADPGPGRRPGGCRAGQQGQERVPLQYEPRYPYPHERHCGDDGHCHRQHQQHPAGTALPEEDLPFQQAPVGAYQRRAGYGQD